MAVSYVSPKYLLKLYYEKNSVQVNTAAVPCQKCEAF